MTDKEYLESLEFEVGGEFLFPSNDPAKRFISEQKLGKKILLKEVSQRDTKFHKAYFDFLNTVYSYLPISFKQRIPKNLFYIFLKELQGAYKVIYKFKNGSEMKEYISISFSKMTQLQFEEYVRNQLPYIYDLFYTLFDKKVADSIIETIEEDYKKFLMRLN